MKFLFQIKDLDSQFHFVLFAEHFDESLGMIRIKTWNLIYLFI